VKLARVALAKLQMAFGVAAVDTSENGRKTMRGFKIAHGKLGRQIRAARSRVLKPQAQRAALQNRVPITEAVKGREVIKRATERKHLTNILKMIAYQIESGLLNLLRPHHARVEDEGRTLIRTALQSRASIEPTDDELRLTLSQLSSPHRSEAVVALREVLNKTHARFPGSKLRMHHKVAGHPS